MRFSTSPSLSACVLCLTLLIMPFFSLQAETGLLEPGAASGQPAPGYSLTEQSYFTDNLGNVLMYVNIWGSVGKTGRFAVPSDTDIMTLLSFVGGPAPDAKLSKMIVYRKNPDEFGKQLYVINIKKMLKTGDTSEFVDLLPNDTIVMPSKSQSNLGVILGTVSTVLSIVNLVD